MCDKINLLAFSQMSALIMVSDCSVDRTRTVVEFVSECYYSYGRSKAIRQVST